MLASIFAAFWFAAWSWYAIIITVQAHTNGPVIPWLVVIVTLLVLALAVLPLILLAV